MACCGEVDWTVFANPLWSPETLWPLGFKPLTGGPSLSLMSTPIDSAKASEPESSADHKPVSSGTTQVGQPSDVPRRRLGFPSSKVSGPCAAQVI